jgi:uncharacterized repeat protein (TIGR03803 family)
MKVTLRQRQRTYVTRIVTFSLSILLLPGLFAEAQTYRFESFPSARFGFGTNPVGTLIADGSCNVYGTTTQGVIYGSGTVFEINRSGKGRVLYTFPGGVNGELPLAGLVRDEYGNLYGTTYKGGDVTCQCVGLC